MELSVIMPVYNAEQYLDESIESILNQTYSQFEFIIINDGSNDSSLSKIEKYKRVDNRIKIITRENKGLVYSLNEGIKAAQGKYIARMDADDISEINRFEAQLSFLKENKDVDILGTYIQVIGDKSSAESIENWFNQTWKMNKALERSIEGCIIAHPTVLMKKKVVDNLGGYRNKYPKFEDDDLWIRALKNGYKIVNLDKKLLQYRVHSESKSNIDSKDYEKFLNEKIFFKLEHFFKGKKENKIFIWGCGRGGRITKECLENSNIKIEGFIDSQKEGFFQGKPIFKSDVLQNIKNPYIIIATQIGFHDVNNYLKEIGVEDYIYIL